MNIPPLISRTPPPISDVVDEEDEDDDDQVSAFSSLQFCSPKTPENKIDEFPKVASSKVFDDNMDSLETGGNNTINDGRKREVKEAVEGRQPVIPFQKRDGESHNDFEDSYVKEISENGTCGPSDMTVSNEIPFDRNIDDSFTIEILGNTINDERDERDLPESSSNYRLSCVADQTKLEDSDHKDSVNKHPIDSDHIPLSQASSIEEDACHNSDEGDAPTDDHLNHYDSKLDDIESIEDGYLGNTCCYMDRSSYVEGSDKQSGLDDKCVINYSADSGLDDDKGSTENTFKPSLVLDNTDILDREDLSSSYTLEFDCDSVVNNAVFEVTDTSPVAEEETSDSFDVISTDKLTRVPDSYLGFVEEVSEVKQKLSSVPAFEQIAPDFCATFPNQVQNYQLDELSKHFSDDDDDDEFSDFVKCSFEPEAVAVASATPESKPSQVLESYQVVSEELVKNQISPLLLLCLKEELKKTAVWTTLSCLENTPALDYGWRSSYSSSRLLSALKIDSRNILSGLWTKSIRKSSSEDGMKQGNMKHKESSYADIGFNEVCVPRPQFEWVGSGLTNPLVDGVNRVKKSSVGRLSSEAETLVASLPDLSYLKQSFIVFPKNIN